MKNRNELTAKRFKELQKEHERLGEVLPTHTPTPWTAKEDGRIVGPSQNDLTVQTIAKVQSYADEVKADAAFIVRAVNCHAELLDIVCMLVEQPDEYRLCPDQVSRYKDLIVKAEGSSSTQGGL